MKETFLLIDDDPIAIFLNKTVINRLLPEAIIETFISAPLALNALKKKCRNLPLIIFLDLNMPEITGWDFMKALENDFPGLNCHVYLLTSSDDEADRVRSQKFKSVRAFLQKPLLPTVLEKLNLDALENSITEN